MKQQRAIDICNILSTLMILWFMILQFDELLKIKFYLKRYLEKKKV